IKSVWGYDLELQDHLPSKLNGISNGKPRPMAFIHDCKDLCDYLTDIGIYNIKEAICFRPRKNNLRIKKVEPFIDKIYDKHKNSKTYLMNPPLDDNELKWFFEGVMAAKSIPVDRQTGKQIHMNVRGANEVMFYNLVTYARKMGFNLNLLYNNPGAMEGTRSNRVVFITLDVKKFGREFEPLNISFNKIYPDLKQTALPLSDLSDHITSF
ncbi:hypothetical protein ACFL6I_22025, partial [candidate division KSB1 bacterium]